MTIRLGVVMDPIGSINTKKDSTFAMLLEARRRGWEVHYMEQGDLFLQNQHPSATMRRLEVEDNSANWFSLEPERETPLEQLDAILMRKDPPSTWSTSIPPICWRGQKPRAC